MATPAVGTRRDAPPFELPDIPKEFGQDNGEFYSRYDALAEELDNNMVDKLKEQLDGHLIFAGLFAGVNSTFLALTLPLLSADPADDINALLRENNAILLQLALNRNDSFPIAKALPSETFSASGRLLTVNILFSISLTFALMSSLFAVLGRQWLVEYRSHSGSGVDDHRRERMNRHLAAGRWRLVWLLEDVIPTLLQIGLILFGISLTIYLSALDPTLTKVVGAFMGTGIGFLVCTAIFALWDPFCPFQTPFSRVITLFTRATFRATTGLIGLALLTAILLIAIQLAAVGSLVLWVGWMINIVLVERRQWTLELQRKGFFSSLESFKQSGELWYRAIHRVPRHSQLSPKGITSTTLEVEAVRRVIRNSNDSATLITCVTNMLAFQNHRVLRRLSLDRQFCNSLIQLCRTAYLEVLRLQGQDRTDLATAVTWRYRAAIAYIGLCGVPVNFIFPTGMNRSIGIDDEPGVSIPSNLIKASTPVLIDGYLAYAVICAWYDVQRFGPSLGRTLEMEFERLIDSTWKRVSILVMCIRVTCPLHTMRSRELITAFAAEPSIVLQNLLILLKKCNDPSCPAHTTSKKYLVPILEFTGKAAIDSSGQSTIEIGLIAKLLRLSEVFLRTEGCPPEFSPVAQGLRRDLISALRSKCEGIPDTDHRNEGLTTKVKMHEARSLDQYSGTQPASIEEWTYLTYAAFWDLMTGARRPPRLGDTVDTLSVLLSNLTAVGDRLTVSSNDDDLELAYLFGPVLQRLDELPLGYMFKVRVRKLRREFENFTSTVNRLAKLVKSPDRDPEHRWCHWREEWRLINA